ncbi:MAG: hypothetical protein LBV80_10310 [Deltaproteobacteria bacterium]|jgi:hypothetical protein|nr:hypothetical protein [Deltaproteobacteria bacterium]
MEKIGLIDEITRNLDRGWEIYEDLEKSLPMQKRTDNLSRTLSLLKDVKATRDLNLALGVEEMMLRQELASYINSPEQYKSVFGAIAQLQEAKNSLEVIKNPQIYQQGTKTYSGKDKEAGLPLDSFRKFIKSHSTRFSNSMKSMLSVPEKNILRQRQENLGMVRDVYIGLQREALGLPAPEKSKGLER